MADVSRLNSQEMVSFIVISEPLSFQITIVNNFTSI